MADYTKIIHINDLKRIPKSTMTQAIKTRNRSFALEKEPSYRGISRNSSGTNLFNDSMMEQSRYENRNKSLGWKHNNEFRNFSPNKRQR